MIYHNYQMAANLADPVRQFAAQAREISMKWFDGKPATPLQRMTAYYASENAGRAE